MSTFMEKRFTIAQYVAIGSTIGTVGGTILGMLNLPVISMIGVIMVLLGIVGGMVSYLFGGFLTALKMAGNITKWGWYVVPFPYDIMTCAFAFAFSMFAFVLIPIIPVRKAYLANEEKKAYAE